MNLPSGKLEKLLAIIFDSVTWLPQWHCCGSESSRDSRESYDRSEQNTGGSSRPWSRLRVRWCLWIIITSLIFFCDTSDLPCLVFWHCPKCSRAHSYWMFFHSGVYTFSSCVFFKSYAKVSACLPNIVVVTVFILYVIHQPALVLFRCFVLGLD